MGKSARTAACALVLCVLLAVGTPIASAAPAAVAGAGTAGSAQPSPPPVAAAAGTLYDPAARAFLWSRAAGLERPVASLTKLMTAWLALQQPPSTPVTAGSDVVGIPQTTAGLVPGRTYTLGSLLPVLIVRSANDVAVAIADGLGGSVPAFVARMNAEAAAMGLAATHYVNPNGLDAAGQHSSAHDVAVLAGEDMAIPAFRVLAALRTATLPGGATFSDENPFLGAYPGADGVKTGFTSTAGFCLAASATRGGRLLIAVVLGEPSWGRAVADAAALLDWGFAQAPATPSAAPVTATTAGSGPAAPAGAAQVASAATPARPAAAAAAVPPASGARSTPPLTATASPSPAASAASPSPAASASVAAGATATTSATASAGPAPRPAAAAPRPSAPAARQAAPSPSATRTPRASHAAPGGGPQLAWITLGALVLAALGISVARRRGSDRGA